MAPRRSTPRRSRSAVACCIEGSKIRNWPLPASFALYMAMSAARSMSVASGESGRAVGDADADADAERPLRQLERTVERVEDPVGDQRRLLLVDFFEQQRELVAAEAGGGVAPAGSSRPAVRRPGR